MSEHIWTPTGTDITVRWRAMGWVPPSEDPYYQNKWAYYQQLPLRTIDEGARAKVEEVMRKAKTARAK